MRLLIVDDEPAARRRLAQLVEEIDPVGLEIVGEASNGLEALECARRATPDVILLDITMPEVDGFDVVRHLPSPRPLIIFQTAHQRFAVDAFDHEALDFVVKPIKKERLAAALERARARLATSTVGPLDTSVLERAGAAVGYQPATPARLLVRHGAGYRLVPISDILRLAAADGVVYGKTATTSPIVDYTLNELEARVGIQFVRTSRADLVNLAHIERVAGNGDGSLTVTLAEGTSVRVSRRRAADVKERLAASG